jgi:ankyrin repeat protein
MSAHRQGGSPKRLPVNPSMENLKKQAKRLAKGQPTLTLQQAQHQLAVEYGCAHWVELTHVVETMSRGATQTVNVKSKMEPLPAAANRSDLDAVRQILSDGPFTQHDLDLALARAVLRFRERRAIAEVLIEQGADPDGQYGSNYGPIVFVTGECLDPDGLQFLIDHGADVTFAPIVTKYGETSPMSSTLGTYHRGQNDRKHRCIDILLRHGALIPPTITPPMLAIHRGDAGVLAEMLDRNPSLLSRRFPDMPFGNIDLRGAGLIHLAVEFGEIECVDALLDRGADINLAAEVIDGVGGQTPIFHAIATILGANVSSLEHLIRRAGPQIDLSPRATFRLFGELQSTPVTALEYAEQASGPDVHESRRATAREIELLKALVR